MPREACWYEVGVCGSGAVFERLGRRVSGQAWAVQRFERLCVALVLVLRWMHRGESVTGRGFQTDRGQKRGGEVVAVKPPTYFFKNFRNFLFQGHIILELLYHLPVPPSFATLQYLIYTVGHA